MKRGNAIYNAQRLIWRATAVIFFIIFVMTVLIFVLNKDPVMGAVMMAINLAIGGIVFGVMKLVRKMTATLYGPPPEQ